MQLAPIPINESQRLEAMYSTNLLYSEPEERFDRLTRIAQKLFNMPTSLVTLVDEERVWFKSRYGINRSEAPRDLSICGHVILNEVTKDPSTRLFEIKNVYKDDRFYDNQFLTEACKIRYYFGFVLQSLDKFNLGVFCLIDSKPNALSEEDKKLFYDLGLVVQAELNKEVRVPDAIISNLLNNLCHEKNPKVFTNNFLSISDKLNSTLPVVNKLMKKNGINFKEWRILNEIVQTNFISPQEICQKLTISASLLSQYLESLELQGLINRAASQEGDKRFVNLECTTAGKEIWVKGLNSTYQTTSSHLAGL